LGKHHEAASLGECAIELDSSFLFEELNGKVEQTEMIRTWIK
jgi:hypothetical protein